jgi:flagellar FliJ protein
MRKFNFRLENFLRIRLHREKNLEIQLAQATGICLSLQHHIQELKEEISENSACTVGGILFDPSDLSVRNLYGKRLEKELHKTKEELVRREQERVKIQQKYLEASRDRKVLEKLKERKSAEYYEMQEKEEIKILDEIAGQFVLQGQKKRKGD